MAWKLKDGKWVDEYGRPLALGAGTINYGTTPDAPAAVANASAAYTPTNSIGVPTGVGVTPNANSGFGEGFLNFGGDVLDAGKSGLSKLFTTGVGTALTGIADVLNYRTASNSAQKEAEQLSIQNYLDFKNFQMRTNDYDQQLQRQQEIRYQDQGMNPELAKAKASEYVLEYGADSGKYRSRV